MSMKTKNGNKKNNVCELQVYTEFVVSLLFLEQVEVTD